MVMAREDLETTFLTEAEKRGSTVARSDLARLPSVLGEILGPSGSSCGTTSGLAVILPSLAPQAAFDDNSWPDTVVARGRLGVAATGSVAVSESRRRDRAMIFLARRVVLLLPTDAIVPGMPDAAPFLRSALARGLRYVTFISGPSRTSDIEQVSIVGAHGPGESIVVLITDWRPSDD